MPLLQSPINSQLIYEITPKISDDIIIRESHKNSDQHMDNLTTHAFLSHKRTSAQGVAGIAIIASETDQQAAFTPNLQKNINFSLILKPLSIYTIYN